MRLVYALLRPRDMPVPPERFTETPEVQRKQLERQRNRAIMRQEREGWMAKWLVLAGILAGLVVAAPAGAQSLTKKALEAFVEDSWGAYGDPDHYDLQQHLFDIAKTTTTPDAVVSAFAQKIGADKATARSYAELIVEVTRLREACESYRETGCQLTPGQPIYERTKKFGLAEPTGGLLFAVATNIDWNFGGPDGEAAIAELSLQHRAAAELLGRLYAYGHEAVYLMPLIGAGKLDENQAAVIAEAAGTLPPEAVVALLSTGRINDDIGTMIAANAGTMSYNAHEWSGWVEALLEAAEQKASSQTARVALAQANLGRKLELGMNAEAVAAWHAYPAEIRAALPLTPSACRKGVACEDLDASGREFADMMAAALWVTGYREEATALISINPSGFKPRGAYDDGGHAALVEAMKPAFANKDLFAIFIEGKVPGWTRPSPLSGEPQFSIGGPEGWLYEVTAASPAIREVVAARLRAGGHADMADHLVSQDPTRYRDEDEDLAARYAFALPAQFAASAAAWKERVAIAEQQLRQTLPAMPIRVSTKPLDAWWKEKRLPDGMQAWTEADGSTSVENLKLPTPAFSVLRHETAGAEQSIVYFSNDYDLPGEIPAYGLWFAETEQGDWQRPVYLGMQQHFPYVVTPASRLPLRSQDGKLTIEVRAEEIDAESISFPPVGLSLKRNEGGIYLEFDLATLRADRDADYLSDIEERRLGLDFANPDTDGDGMPDGVDPIPLIAHASASDPLDMRMARAIAEKIMGHEIGAIVVGPQKPDSDPLLSAVDGGPPGAHTLMMTVFLVADPALFAGANPRFRLMLYSDADVAALSTGAAPFLPPRLLDMFTSLDRRTRFITWSAGWVGGSFFVRCSAGDEPCEIESVSDWIT